jgi:hypothetical protein
MSADERAAFFDVYSAEAGLKPPLPSEGRAGLKPPLPSVVSTLLPAAASSSSSIAQQQQPAAASPTPLPAAGSGGTGAELELCTGSRVRIQGLLSEDEGKGCEGVWGTVVMNLADERLWVVMDNGKEFNVPKYCAHTAHTAPQGRVGEWEGWTQIAVLRPGEHTYADAC